MATPTITLIEGKLNRDMRLDGTGKPAAGGRLYLRGERVNVHPDYARDLLQPAKAKAPKTKASQVHKQTIPPATTDA